MAEQSLANIIDAADPADSEDLAIRQSLVAALSEGGIELAQLINGRSRLLGSCGRGAPWRVSVVRAPLSRRCLPAVAGAGCRYDAGASTRSPMMCRLS
jgi:hypothetical protein